uniref:Uncharacterized protein n=1 Tax=Salvator merianae TaxID=96440 RepID=A0A8D0EET9_SALMN
VSFVPTCISRNGSLSNSTSVRLHETEVIEKLLTSYGSILCSELQARIFFHFESGYTSALHGRVNATLRLYPHTSRTKLIIQRS